MVAVTRLIYREMKLARIAAMNDAERLMFSQTERYIPGL